MLPGLEAETIQTHSGTGPTSCGRRLDLPGTVGTLSRGASLRHGHEG